MNQHTATSPSYNHIAGRVRVRNSAAERGVFRRRRKTRPSEWAEIHRVVTLSSLPGPWRNYTTPYLAGIMDASFHPAVQEISLCKVPQTGGSEAVNNCIAYAMHLAPGPAMYVYPDELTARENCQDRIGPMFTASPSLRNLMTGRDDDAAALKIKLLRAPIYMAWSRSVSRLANKPIRYLVFDETDKYQTSNAAETDPIRLGEKRTTTFRWNRKIWKISSPTVEAGYIWQAMLAAQVVFVFAAVCPLCGGKQVMSFGEAGKPGGIKWPEDERDPDTIETSELATYQCSVCLGQWSDYQRDQAVRLGSWQAKHDGRGLEAYLDAFRPRRIAFHLPAWLSPFISLSKIAGAWLRCKNHDGSLNLDAYKDFQNGYAAEPWFNLHQDRHEDDILKLRDDRPSGIIPGGDEVAALLATVDTQDNGFWYEVRAAGWGKIGDSWGVRSGFADTPAALVEALFASDYRDAAGTRYPLRAALIDAMGHRTAEVYDLCRDYPGRLIPLKGERRMKSGHAWSNIEYYPGTQKAIPGGVKLLRVNTGFYKDILAAKLAVGSGDPGSWRLAADYDEPWAKMLCAEYLDERGEWTCPSGRANHAFDLGCYYLALVDLLGIRYWPKPGEQGETKKTADKPEKTSTRW
jgi:terminase, large subunit